MNFKTLLKLKTYFTQIQWKKFVYKVNILLLQVLMNNSKPNLERDPIN